MHLFILWKLFWLVFTPARQLRSFYNFVKRTQELFLEAYLETREEDAKVGLNRDFFDWQMQHYGLADLLLVWECPKPIGPIVLTKAEWNQFHHYRQVTLWNEAHPGDKRTTDGIDGLKLLIDGQNRWRIQRLREEALKNTRAKAMTAEA